MSSCLHAVPKNRCGSICRSHLSEKLLHTTASRARVVDHHTMVITCSSRKRENNHFHFHNTSFLYTGVHQNSHPCHQHCIYSTNLVDVYSFEIVAERWKQNTPCMLTIHRFLHKRLHDALAMDFNKVFLLQKIIQLLVRKCSIHQCICRDRYSIFIKTLVQADNTQPNESL